MDKILINNMDFLGYHGVLPEETKHGQMFRVQAVLHINLAVAGKMDDLSKTIHYGEAFEVIKAIVEGRPQQLIETVAEMIAQTLLAKYALLESCTIQVEKLNPPIDGHTGTVAVEITRRQLIHHAYLSLGTNMGDRYQHLQDAVHLLQNYPDIIIMQKSSVYETKPVGYDQQDYFLNMVVHLRTALSSTELLNVCQLIEKKLGRKRTIRWGPRTIDLDILLFDHEQIELEQLQIPHPRMHERAFVLVPLAELNKQIILPNHDETIGEMLEGFSEKEIQGVSVWKK